MILWFASWKATKKTPMKNVVLFFLGCLLFENATYCQTSSKYTKFMMHGVEFQTNGKDTICIVDPMPQYPGGSDALLAFEEQNINYPETARRDHIEGKVLVSFVVDRTGVIRNVIIKQGVRDDLDYEAMRVVKMMPKWKPGEIKGVPVSVKFTLPINFRLTN